ncbi:MAG TPA: hypothetical protein VGM33_15165 [Baekduia sp.]|jgi:hypothetical protein
MTDLVRLRAAYPPLPDEAPPHATVARMAELYANADGVSGAPTWFGRAPRRHRRPASWLALLAAGTVVAGGTALAATGAWHPVLGSPDRGPQPLAAGAGVPADQLAALAILRRPQTDADRGPLVQSALKVLSRELINGIHTDAIRVVHHGPREVVVLIPAERVGPHERGRRLPVERNVLCLMSGSYLPATSLKTIHLPAGYSWGMACGGMDRVGSTGLETGYGGRIVGRGTPAKVTSRRVTLVPDGVARVTVRLRGGRSVTVPVKDNVYSYRIHGSPAYLGTTWFGADGRRIEHRKR